MNRQRIVVGGSVQFRSVQMPVLRCVLVAALLISPANARAQTARDSVISTVDQFFRAMAARDTGAIARLVTADGSFFAMRTQGDTLAYSIRSNAAWIRQLGASRDTLIERMWTPTVMVHGPLAVLWTPYDIWRNGAFLHCGVDAFTLIRTNAGWRIGTIAFTMEPTGCAPSPLGPLRPDRRDQ
jgi:hypothetical protein